MSQKTQKAIRKAAIKYARSEERAIAREQMENLYFLPFRYRLIFAFGVLFKTGLNKVNGKEALKNGKVKETGKNRKKELPG
jgi:hypothetical protein